MSDTNSVNTLKHQPVDSEANDKWTDTISFLIQRYKVTFVTVLRQWPVRTELTKAVKAVRKSGRVSQQFDMFQSKAVQPSDVDCQN